MLYLGPGLLSSCAQLLSGPPPHPPSLWGLFMNSGPKGQPTAFRRSLTRATMPRAGSRSYPAHADLLPVRPRRRGVSS